MYHVRWHMALNPCLPEWPIGCMTHVVLSCLGLGNRSQVGPKKFAASDVYKLIVADNQTACSMLSASRRCHSYGR